MNSIYCPRLIDQINDESRTNLISYVLSKIGMYTLTTEEDPSRTICENVALRELIEFLASEADDSTITQNLRDEVSDILKYLNFIGKKEFDYATSVLAQYYKDFLDSNVKNQLVIQLMSEINSQSKTKSDIFVLDGILSHFSPEDMKKYRGRIHRSFDETTIGTENIKAVLLDDWSISGEQMRYSGYLYRYDDASIKPEINFLIAKRAMLEDGYNYFAYGSRDLNDWYDRLKVYAPFVAREKDEESAADFPRITGFYSSVDYGFEESISRIVVRSERGLKMPPLTNIIRPYRCNGYIPTFVEAYFNSTEYSPIKK